MKELGLDKPMVPAQPHRPSHYRTNDRERLKRYGMRWSVKAQMATSYANWLRRHRDFVCSYCSQPIPKKANQRHADHVQPLSQGGTHTVDNIVPSCQRCNLSKHDKIYPKPLIPSHLTPTAWTTNKRVVRRYGKLYSQTLELRFVEADRLPKKEPEDAVWIGSSQMDQYINTSDKTDTFALVD